MGDRVSLQFKNGKELSPVLFHHWGGAEFVQTVPRYLAQLPPNQERISDPISRREPRTIFVDFIAWLLGKDRPNYSLYVGETPNDGDNSDNGHYIYDLGTGEISHVKGRYE